MMSIVLVPGQLEVGRVARHTEALAGSGRRLRGMPHIPSSFFSKLFGFLCKLCSFADILV